MNPSDDNNSGENQFTGQGGGFLNLLAGENLFRLGTQSSQFLMGSFQITSQEGLPLFHGTQYAGFSQGGYVGVGRPTNTSSFGNDVYRPTMSPSAFGTPGIDESTVPLSNFNFSTDEYGVSDMESSPPRTKAAAKAKGKRKEKVEAKSSEGGQGGCTRSTSIALARCWADISEDPIVANNQGEDGFWGRITQRYEQVKPDGALTHKPGDLRKHWKCMVFECTKFHGIYDGHLRKMRSGESELSVRDLSLKEFRATINSKGFKY